MSDLSSRTDLIAEIEAEMTEMGTEAGRRIMAQTVHDALDPDQMTTLVNETTAWMYELLIEAGGQRGDVRIVVDVFRRALIREGKRIAEGVSAEGGRA